MRQAGLGGQSSKRADGGAARSWTGARRGGSGRKEYVGGVARGHVQGCGARGTPSLPTTASRGRAVLPQAAPFFSGRPGPGSRRRRCGQWPCPGARPRPAGRGAQGGAGASRRLANVVCGQQRASRAAIASRAARSQHLQHLPPTWGRMSRSVSMMRMSGFNLVDHPSSTIVVICGFFRWGEERGSERGGWAAGRPAVRWGAGVHGAGRRADGLQAPRGRAAKRQHNKVQKRGGNKWRKKLTTTVDTTPRRCTWCRRMVSIMLLMTCGD